jgi:hypothetical protein
MVPTQEPTNDAKQDEHEVLDLTSRKRKKGRVAVSIRKGTLLFFPTAVPVVGEKLAESVRKPIDGKKTERT